MRSSLRNRSRGVAQVGKHLLRKHRILSSNSSAAIKKKKIQDERD
jgi:hypothetical protein